MSRRRALLTAAGAVVAVLGLLGVEVVVAGEGPKLSEFDPHGADGEVEPDPAGYDGTAPEPGPDLRVVWFGDSTAAGVGASEAGKGVARQVARASGRRVHLEVRAVSGARALDLETQVSGLRTDPRIDVILISAGANDVTHSLDLKAFRAAYERALDLIPPDATLVLLGVPDMGSVTRLAQPLRALAGFQANRYDGVVRDIAAARHAAYVDIPGQTGPHFRADPGRLLAADHYHPSDAGYGVWRDAIVPVLAWALQRREHPDRAAPPRPAESGGAGG